MNISFQNKKYLVRLLPAFVLIAGLFFFGGYVFAQKNSVLSKEPVITPDTTEGFDMFWKVWHALDQKSPFAGEADAKERMYGAIMGMAASLNDPYTVFFPPEDNKMFQEQVSGSFGGVGMELAIKEGVLTVIAPLKDTPAWNAGIKSGDKVIKINATSTNEMSVEKAVSLIRGKEGTTVTLSLYREGEKEPRTLTLTRSIIVPPVIETKIEGDVFVITLYSFSANAHVKFQQALQEFSESNRTRLIVDLRGNPGGYLDSAVDIASWFLPKKSVVVRERFNKDTKEKIHYSTGYDVFNKNLRVVVLIDGGSASASEILAGALKENGIATIVGEKSFGKGSVQEVVPITEDTSLKVTIAEWLTPQGHSISKVGITPDISIARGTDPKKDLQLLKAIEVVRQK